MRGSALLVLALPLLVACGASASVDANVNSPNTEQPRTNAAVAKASNRPNGPDPKRPWWQPPGPIEGKWKTSVNPNNMVVEIIVSGNKATGRVVTVGDGTIRHYANGDQILDLEVDDFGQWVGTLQMKVASGGVQKEPIRFVATAGGLDAIMSADNAFKNMTKVE